MKVFGINIGGKSEPKKNGSKQSLDLKKVLSKASGFFVKYEVVIIIVLVGGLLALTASRMFSYIDPAVDEERAAENITKLKHINIDPKVVERIKALNDSQTGASTNFQGNRDNPFSE